ncbi:CTP synthase [Candidatus Babeliales bacterium]|nr:CTP synthase [Candidatus Babeliales bacterium]
MDLKNLTYEVRNKGTKFIVITGGVCSSIGKGVLVSSLGVLLKGAGYSVSVIKWDPYLNVDPGTMSPLEHGEVFVTHDGAETDLDLGHYERTLGISLSRDSSVSSGQIFKSILDGEREGKFLGKCIQLVPHVVDAIKTRLFAFALNHDVDFVLLEIGGTVGDIEGKVFLEAVRQVRSDLHPAHIFHGHLSYVPRLEWTGEIKTKPTQHSVNALKEEGLVPDCIFLRTSLAIEEKQRRKLATMCGVSQDLIFEVLTYKPVYPLFIDLQKQEVSKRIQEYFGILAAKPSNLSQWQDLIERIGACKTVIKVALVAKYVGSNDPYMSVIDAIQAAGYANNVTVDIVVIDAEQLENSQNNEAWILLKSAEGIIIPGGFDKRGGEGKIAAVRWAREQQIPYLGLCLGMQVMLIEFGRSLVNLAHANTTEFDKKTPHPIISLLEEQAAVVQKGASMRLGEYACTLVPGSKAHQAYEQDEVRERHRHRYEFNNSYKQDFEAKGVLFSGLNPDSGLVEISELQGHPFMVGSQFHPEFLSGPLKPHPLFKAFIKAVLEQINKK